MKLRKITFNYSSKYIIEKHKPLIPTVIHFHQSIGVPTMITFKFAFWRWWIKLILIFY